MMMMKRENLFQIIYDAILGYIGGYVVCKITKNVNCKNVLLPSFKMLIKTTSLLLITLNQNHFENEFGSEL